MSSPETMELPELQAAVEAISDKEVVAYTYESTGGGKVEDSQEINGMQAEPISEGNRAVLDALHARVQEPGDEADKILQALENKGMKKEQPTE